VIRQGTANPLERRGAQPLTAKPRDLQCAHRRYGPGFSARAVANAGKFSVIRGRYKRPPRDELVVRLNKRFREQKRFGAAGSGSRGAPRQAVSGP